MVKTLGVVSLLVGLPVVAMAALTLYKSYYGPLAECSELQGRERDKCLTGIAENIPSPSIEQVMANCRASERFMFAYEVSRSMQKEYSQTPAEMRALYKSSCGSSGNAG